MIKAEYSGYFSIMRGSILSLYIIKVFILLLCPLTAGCCLRVRIFCGREEDEDCQVFCNRMKAVFVARFHKYHRSCFNWTTLCTYLDGTTPTDDVIHFVFGMWFLHID